MRLRLLFFKKKKKICSSKFWGAILNICPVPRIKERSWKHATSCSWLNSFFFLRVMTHVQCLIVLMSRVIRKHFLNQMFHVKRKHMKFWYIMLLWISCWAPSEMKNQQGRSDSLTIDIVVTLHPNFLILLHCILKLVKCVN